MKRIVLTILLFILLFITGCNSKISTDWNDYVGEYVFTSNAVPRGSFTDFADVVILKKDATAIEIRFSKDTDQVQITETTWDLRPREMNLRLFGKDFPYTEVYLSLKGFSHPVEGSPPKIKLGAHSDLGLYYIKVR